jgi:glycosyltransferase involved in cell wall biosynthesis
VRVIIAHNRYQQPGGEDIGVQDERGLLVNHGHEVRLLEANNDHIRGLLTEAYTALTAVYSLSSKRRMTALIAEFRPDLVHVHNFFPVLSPSIYCACNEAGVPVVQTLHNYRLLCPSSILFRDGHVCEDCLSKRFAWPGVAHACYRGSRLGTAAVATMTYVHRVIRTYQRQIQALVALTEFSRRKFIEGGFPAHNIVVKPPFVDIDFGIGHGEGRYVLFVGRLSDEKGIITLLEAWKKLGTRVPLRIAGSGRLEEYVRAQEAAMPGIRYLGYQSRPQINQLVQNAVALVFPSLWYEGVPRTILESFAAGTPVIASKIGNVEGLVEHKRLGLHFQPGDAADLVAKVQWMLEHPHDWESMRQSARAEYEAKYSAERNYDLLMEIYDRVLTRNSLALAIDQPKAVSVIGSGSH